MTVPVPQSDARRARVHGRSILVGGRKFHVRGVTYGTFRGPDGSSFPAPERVREDFAAMAAAGVNAIRTYVPPPAWLLDLALDHGIHVMVGFGWEQHVAFLDDLERAQRIARRLGDEVRALERHPAILCYSVGNEIPAAIVRWHGKRATERFLERLYWEAKSADPEGLVTYVNYPSTEYLELPFLDVCAFNVFIEQEPTFEAYLARLQNLSGDRPLLITELGLDSRRNGAEEQARVLEWQVRHAFGTGAAGAFVFAWTDEWHRGGHDVEDWAFGLVDREREPKPALYAVRSAFASVPFAPGAPWPSVSVVVCTHNGEKTLDECLARVRGLSYPDYEVIVVNDGSSEACSAIARRHGVKLIATDHRGLGHARNQGIEAARGEVVAFLDDDAYPDSDWLHYLAASLRGNGNAGVGGPNIPPEDDGFVAECVAAAPGGPIHVLVSDREAEHVPGCNMAFRKDVLEEVGSFDERFKVAGDDVDLCWRLQKAGRTLGFSAGAVVMHRRRDSIGRYLRQQYGYGKAEALLERKWPTHYNRAGSSRWSGRIYEAPAAQTPRRRAMVRYGTWGGGLFQSIYEPPRVLSGLLQAPEGLMLVALLGLLSALGLLWRPLLVAAPVFLVAIAWIVAAAVGSGWRAHRPVPGRGGGETLKRRGVTTLLFLLQPFARLAGRLRNGLSPWRRRTPASPTLPRPRTVEVWSERWREPGAWIEALQDALAVSGGFVRSGGPFDRWDLDLRAGALGGVKIRTAVEEHGGGRQLLRARIWPRTTAPSRLIALFLVLLTLIALHQHRPAIAIGIVVLLLIVVVLGLEGMATATRLAVAELESLREPERVAEESALAPAGSRAETRLGLAAMEERR
ncbi:MAG TPA: glycosyltransferase [Solirubrobacterales bacterium]|nr:glycosyltransferase [Solirubrobacterales bacterium]